MKQTLGILAVLAVSLSSSWAWQAEPQKPPAQNPHQQPAQKPQAESQPLQATQKPQNQQSPQPTKKPPARKPAPIQTFLGVISDGQCAAKGSHKEVMQKARVNTVANCVKGCSRRHGYVLYIPSTKKVYKLNDQERPAELAGKRVKIKGALNPQTQTIFVSSIEPAN